MKFLTRFISNPCFLHNYWSCLLNSIKFSKIHSSPGRIRGHATTGQAGCRLFDEHDTEPRPGYFCIFTQCQRGFFTPNIIGTGHCLRQKRRAGAALKYSVNLDYRVDYISQVSISPNVVGLWVRGQALALGLLLDNLNLSH